MKCLYEDYCHLYNTPECGASCTKYKLVQYLLDKSMIPKSRQRIQKFNIPKRDERIYNQLSHVCQNIEKYVDSGTNFVLYSENTGNGKTSWAIKMLIAYFNAIWSSNGFKPRGYFVHVPTYLASVKAAINCPDEKIDEIQRNICDIDILVLDDLGTNQMSDYDIGLLTHIIDQRWLNQKCTIYTTNRDREKLRQVMGERITDRVWDGCVLHFTGSSNRGI